MIKNLCKLKGTVSVISSDLACKGDNALFILVSLSFRKTTLFEWEKRRYLLHFRSDQCFVVSRALSSLHVGSLEITLTVPLSLQNFITTMFQVFKYKWKLILTLLIIVSLCIIKYQDFRCPGKMQQSLNPFL